MECLTPTRAEPATCTICGRHKDHSDNWFLITENGWDDHLTVWRWHRQMAARASVHSLCSPRHVRELVVHWMTTGCLHYPFATFPMRAADASFTQAVPANDYASDPVSTYLCEVAVDREGIVRVLRENPLSLNTILQELMIVLENEIIEEPETEGEGRTSVAVRCM